MKKDKKALLIIATPKNTKGGNNMGGMNGALKGLLPGASLNAGKGESKQAKQVKGEMKKMSKNGKKGVKK